MATFPRIAKQPPSNVPAHCFCIASPGEPGGQADREFYIGFLSKSIDLFLQAPAISGPSTGTCGPITIRYGSSGSPDAKLQTFVAPAPLFIPSCNPASSDTYTYILGVIQQSNYVLPGPGRPVLRCMQKIQMSSDGPRHESMNR